MDNYINPLKSLQEMVKQRLEELKNNPPKNNYSQLLTVIQKKALEDKLVVKKGEYKGEKVNILFLDMGDDMFHPTAILIDYIMYDDLKIK